MLQRKKFAKVGSACIASALLCLLVTTLVFPALGITPTSKREVLSIPIQQVARCIVEHDEEIDDETKAIINRVISYETVKEKYNPRSSDPSKATYNEQATNDDVRAFFRVWISFVKKYPATCMDAFIANTYGYYYISMPKNGLRGHYNYEWSIQCISNSYIPWVKSSTAAETAAQQREANNHSWTTLWYWVWFRAPVVSVLSTAGFWCLSLLVLLTYCLSRKRKLVALVALLPFLIGLVCLIGPVNGIIYLRYVFPIALILPILIPMSKLAIGISDSANL